MATDTTLRQCKAKPRAPPRHVKQERSEGNRIGGASIIAFGYHWIRMQDRAGVLISAPATRSGSATGRGIPRKRMTVGETCTADRSDRLSRHKRKRNANKSTYGRTTARQLLVVHARGSSIRDLDEHVHGRKRRYRSPTCSIAPISVASKKIRRPQVALLLKCRPLRLSPRSRNLNAPG